MSDGISDAARTDAKIIEAWKQGEMNKFLSYIPTADMVAELCKREGVTEATKNKPRPPCEECIYEAQAAQERETVLPTDEELKALKQAVCFAIQMKVDGFEIADNYYHKLKSLRKGAP